MKKILTTTILLIGIAAFITTVLLRCGNEPLHDKQVHVQNPPKPAKNSRSTRKHRSANLSEHISTPTPQPCTPELPEEKHLSQPVKTILGLGTEKQPSYREKLEAVTTLSDGIDHEDVSALYWFLSQIDPETFGDLAHNAIKNDVLEKLIKQRRLPENLGALMLNIYYNTEQDPTWRDYLVQYFGDYLQRIRPTEQSDYNTVEWEQFRAAYNHALTEIDAGIAGTALIGLEIMAENYADYTKEDSINAAAVILENPATSNLTKTTALQIAAESHNPDPILEKARTIAADPRADTTLRMSAIYTISRSQQPDDKDFLKKLLNSEDIKTASGRNDKRLETAALAALKRNNQTQKIHHQ